MKADELATGVSMKDAIGCFVVRAAAADIVAGADANVGV